MLHGMIPAAFFATLLRRYLDSLVETQQYVATSSALTSFGMGTSAAVAGAGIALFGFSRFSRRKPSTQTTEVDETSQPAPVADKKETYPTLQRKRRRSRIRKRHHRGKKHWILKNMKHYKSKYGRRIGKLMNQLVGVPFTESPVEPIDSDASASSYDDDDDNCSDVFRSATYINATPLAELKRADDRRSVDRSFPDDFSCKISSLTEDDSVVASDASDDSPSNTLKGVADRRSVDRSFPDDFSYKMSHLTEDDNVVAPKDYFDEDDMEGAGVSRKRSSSLDLNDLLRDNFERQKMRQSSRRSSLMSGRSRKSSRSCHLCNSRKSISNHSRSSRECNMCSQHESPRETSSYKCMSSSAGNKRRSGRRTTKVTKQTRSGRCYDYDDVL